MFDSQFGCNLKLKGAMSLYFRVFRGNLYLITSGKLENGKVEFQFYLLIKLSLHKKQDDSVQKRPLSRRFAVNLKNVGPTVFSR